MGDGCSASRLPLLSSSACIDSKLICFNLEVGSAFISGPEDLSRLESSSLGGSPKIPIGGYECIEAECSIEPTWVGQDPDLGAAKPDGLLSPVDLSLPEDGCEGRLT